MGVPPMGGGGPGCFPLARGFRRRFVVVPSATAIEQPNCPPL